jgi:1-acyl-sn-glycerol-3-phosphate acyltransferase
MPFRPRRAPERARRRNPKAKRAAPSGPGLGLESLARLWSRFYFAWHSDEVDEFGYDPKFTETILPFFEFLYTVWWRVQTEGIDNVPRTGPALIVANHSGVLPWDGIMINLAVRHEHPARRACRMLALDMFALLPFLAPLLAQSGAVRANPENAERLLRKGELVGVFPEGVKGVGKRFKDRYKLARFGRGGFIRIALRTGAPIVPCAVVGAEEIHPALAQMNWLGKPLGLPYVPITPTFPLLGPLGFVPLPSKWSIEMGEPLRMDEYGPDAAEDPMLVNRLSERVRGTIQAMVDAGLARRRSVWFG